MKNILLPALLLLGLLLSACAAPAPQQTPEPTPQPEEFPPCDVLFIGHSLTAYGKFGDYFPDKVVVNLGIPGGVIEDMIGRVPTAAAHAPKKIFVMAAANDLFDEELDMDRVEEQYRELLDALLEACPDAEIYIESELPVTKRSASSWGINNKTIRQFNERVKAMAEEYGLEYLDIYSAYDYHGGLKEELSEDGVHLKTAAYSYWADIIRPYIEGDEK